MKTLFLLILALYLSTLSEAFGVANSSSSGGRRATVKCMVKRCASKDDDKANNNCSHDDSSDYTSRRRFLESASAVAASSLLFSADTAQAAVGSLPEFADSNAILQGITVKVADPSQEKAMRTFLEDAFDCKVLRQRIRGTVTETWLGFGPEQLSIPSDFTIPVSSFAKYGGHASIHLVYDSRTATPLYRMGDETPPGNSIAYLQLGVPSYRVSQMVKNGGVVTDAYGFVSVVSPSGLPIRGIVGISPDPIMFVAINCADVTKSKSFYEQLGFVEQEYPYCRPNKGQGQFEPAQPPKSVYLAPSKNSMGVLLLQSKKKRITPNPAVEGLQIVYTPSAASSDGAAEDARAPRLVDPSGVALQFQSAADFEAEEKITR